MPARARARGAGLSRSAPTYTSLRTSLSGSAPAAPWLRHAVHRRRRTRPQVSRFWAQVALIWAPWRPGSPDARRSGQRAGRRRGRSTKLSGKGAGPHRAASHTGKKRGEREKKSTPCGRHSSTARSDRGISAAHWQRHSTRCVFLRPYAANCYRLRPHLS